MACLIRIIRCQLVSDKLQHIQLVIDAAAWLLWLRRRNSLTLLIILVILGLKFSTISSNYCVPTTTEISSEHCIDSTDFIWWQCRRSTFLKKLIIKFKGFYALWALEPDFPIARVATVCMSVCLVPESMNFILSAV